MPTAPPPPRRQLTLLFPDTPAPSKAVWVTLEPATREAALQALARILARAAAPPAPKETRDD